MSAGGNKVSKGQVSDARAIVGAPRTATAFETGFGAPRFYSMTAWALVTGNMVVGQSLIMTVQLVHCRGMVGAIETIMASQAQTSVGAFIGFCVRRCAGGAPGAEGGMDSGLGVGPGYLLRPSGGGHGCGRQRGGGCRSTRLLRAWPLSQVQPTCSPSERIVISISILLSFSSAGPVCMLSACSYISLR